MIIQNPSFNLQIPGGGTEDLAQTGTEIQTCDGDAANVDFCKFALICNPH